MPSTLPSEAVVADEPSPPSMLLPSMLPSQAVAAEHAVSELPPPTLSSEAVVAEYTSSELPPHASSELPPHTSSELPPHASSEPPPLGMRAAGDVPCCPPCSRVEPSNADGRQDLSEGSAKARGEWAPSKGDGEGEGGAITEPSAEANAEPHKARLPLLAKEGGMATAGMSAEP